jgi:hypothetical protein
VEIAGGGLGAAEVAFFWENAMMNPSEKDGKGKRKTVQ